MVETPNTTFLGVVEVLHIIATSWTKTIENVDGPNLKPLDGTSTLEIVDGTSTPKALDGVSTPRVGWTSNNKLNSSRLNSHKHWKT